MGRRRRWERLEREGLEDVASAIAQTVGAVGDHISANVDPVDRERRRQEKLERRRQYEARSRRTLMAVGAGLLAGGLTASMGLITVAAVGVGLLVAGLVTYIMRLWDEAPRRPLSSLARPTLDDPTIAGQDARATLIRAVIADAMGHLRAIDRIAASAQDLEIAAILTRIAAIGHRICQAAAAQPASFEKAKRLLTYHVEKAAKLAELSAEADPARLIAVRKVLARMEQLFEETEADLKHEDRRELDLELRLIDQALDEDLRR